MSVPGRFDGRAYQERVDALVRRGVDVHGEADFVAAFGPRRVLDAGCGTGRVAIELARRGVAVVGVDRDRSMLAEARRLAPMGRWVEADLATLELGATFDVVVLAGNVPLFCDPGARDALVASCASHVVTGGRLVCGFELGRGYVLADYDRACLAGGLVLVERYATWDRAPFGPGAGYALSVHLRPGTEPAG